MTVETATAEAIPSERASAVSLIDSDVHNYPNTIDELTPFLSERWQAYIAQSGLQRSSWTRLSQGVRTGRAPRFLARQRKDSGQ